MKTLQNIRRFFLRFRYPFSLPEDIASALGIQTQRISFTKLISNVTHPDYRPGNLTRFMPRSQAERAFQTALRKEKFQNDSLFSYYVNGAWVEFTLHFDTESRLRRLYLRYKDLKQAYEIPISK